MNARPEILTGTEVSTGRRKPSDLVAEYEAKRDAIPEAIAAYEAAGVAIKAASTVGGTWGRETISTGSVYDRQAHSALLASAWRHTYELYGLEQIASAEDKRRIEQMFASPPPFTIDNIRDQFGAYVMDPWGCILRGLAEVFSQLDPAFESHDKMRIGVKGLPKRVIMGGVGSYGSWGRDRLHNLLNALAAYQSKPLPSYAEIGAILEDGDALKEERGVWLKRFSNGNGHLFFTPETLADINRALAEYYGDVLADCPEERPAKQRTGTDVSKDLQYYPTPAAVVRSVMSDLIVQGERILEPSCGCGRFMDALRTAGAQVIGCEYDAGRAAICEGKGHRVIRANFLETVPTADFDQVVMNPPFAGRHYAKHVRHALKFLKPGGKLTAILPITARHDHGELDDLNPRWSDLPVGSFSESGTNINTTVATIRKAAQ